MQLGGGGVEVVPFGAWGAGAAEGHNGVEGAEEPGALGKPREVVLVGVQGVLPGPVEGVVRGGIMR